MNEESRREMFSDDPDLFDRPPEELTDEELLERIAELDVPLSETCRRALERGRRQG